MKSLFSLFTFTLIFFVLLGAGTALAEEAPPVVPNYEELDFDQLPFQKKWTHEDSDGITTNRTPPTCIGYSEAYFWSGRAYGIGFTSCNGRVDYIAAYNYLMRENSVLEVDSQQKYNDTYAQGATGPQSMIPNYTYWTRTLHQSIWGLDARSYYTFDYV